MRQEIHAENFVDRDGNPAGGSVRGLGIVIEWGPLSRGAQRLLPNGAFVEGVIEAARQRIEFYQTATGGKFKHEENAKALYHLEQALAYLDARTRTREQRAAEGTHVP